VPPLALPDPAHLPEVEALAQTPSVALFVRRASEVNPRFALTPDNAPAVAEICQRLDGLPLALELAAARVNLLPPRQLLERLSHRLPLLTRGERDLPERQQTLRNMMAWSYDLLDAREQQLFRSLAVLSGGFSLDAASALESERADLFDCLESLVSKNLLRVEPGSDGAPRFSMLATVREYAGEKLDEEGERAAMQERAAQYFLHLALTAEPHLSEPDRETWLERLDPESVNLRETLVWCLDHPACVELGLLLAGALTFNWYHSGYLREGASCLEAMLARTRPTDRSYARAKALYGSALLSWKQGETDAAARHAEEALAIFRGLGDRLWIGHAEWVLAVSRMSQGQLGQSRELLEECLRIFRDAKNRWGEANALAFLGVNSQIRGDYDAALAYYRDAAALWDAIHDLSYGSVALGVLAGARASLHDQGAATFFFGELKRRIEQARNRWTIGRLLQSAGFNMQYNYRLYEAAKFLYQGSLLLWRELERLEGGFSIVRSLLGLGEIAAADGQMERAGWLFGAADHLTPSSGTYREALDARIARTGGSLPEASTDVFKAAWAEGRAATVEQAIDKALALS
jgi:tetratricopeptide (TPR) repeat protein